MYARVQGFIQLYTIQISDDFKYDLRRSSPCGVKSKSLGSYDKPVREVVRTQNNII
jgi:hypothetical protein